MDEKSVESSGDGNEPLVCPNCGAPVQEWHIICEKCKTKLDFQPQQEEKRKIPPFVVPVVLIAVIVIAVVVLILTFGQNRSGTEQGSPGGADSSAVIETPPPESAAPVNTSEFVPDIPTRTPNAPMPESTAEPESEPLPLPDVNPYASVQTGDMIQFAGYDWRVLEVVDDSALILCDIIPEFRAYHNPSGVTPNPGEIIWPEGVTWEECDLRRYLNKYFYDKTFTQEDKALIIESLLEHDDNHWFGTPGGNDTLDKLFLLSLSEVIKYLGDSGQLENPEFDYWLGDDYNEERIAADESGEATYWWLRTPGYQVDGVVMVADDGFIYVYGGDAANDFPGIRPALWLNLKSADSAESADSADSTE